MPAALGFSLVALMQVIGAVTTLRSDRFRRTTIWFNVAILVGWLLSRTVGFPFTPLGVEAITIHDAAATALEIVGIGGLLNRRPAGAWQPVLAFGALSVSATAAVGLTVAGPVAHAEQLHVDAAQSFLAATVAGRALAADPDVHLHGLTADGSDAGLDPSRSLGSALDAIISPVASQPSALAADAHGALWIAHRSGSITRIQAGTSDRWITIDGSPTAILVAFDAIWVTDIANDRVLELDPSTGAMRRSIRVGIGPIAITATSHRIWISTITDGWLQPIDPTTGRVGRHVPVGYGPIALDADDDTLLVVNALDRTVQLVETTGDHARASEPIPVGAGASDAVLTAHAFWVSNASDGTVQRFERSTRTLEATYLVDPVTQPGLGPSALVSDGGSRIFVVNNQDRSVRAISTDGTVSEPRFFSNLRAATPTRQDVLLIDADLVLTDFEGAAIAHMPISLFDGRTS